MSLFGSFFGMDDPFLMGTSQIMREMDSMANAMMRGAFPMMSPMMPQLPPQPTQMANALMPFGNFGGMAVRDPFGLGMFGNMMQQQGNCQVFSSSSVTTFSAGPDGRPVVYQASTSSRSGPGGVRETRKTVSDSRSGVRKMAIGRHLGEKSHILEKEQNVRTGETEEREDLINLEEEEVPEFDREWGQKARGSYGSRPMRSVQGSAHQQQQRPLAITAGSSSHGQRYQPHQRDRNSSHHDGHRIGKRQRTNK